MPLPTPSQQATEGFLADRSTRLILDALARAAAAPAGMPLFAGRAGPGLFPATTAAKQIARRCQDEGLIVIRDDSAGKGNREVATITDRGLDWLATQSSPKQVLEDFLRVLEERRTQTADLISAARQMAAGLDALRSAVERLAVPTEPSEVHHSVPASHDEPSTDTEIMTRLDEWHATSSGDCPLPELFRRVSARHTRLTVGQFHDVLRELHEAGRVYLHPWTGPLYELPEPRFALLVGHLVAYYASPRSPLMASPN